MASRSRLLVLVALLGLLVAPTGARAQGGEGAAAWTLTADATAFDVPLGGTANTTLTLSNTKPHTVVVAFARTDQHLLSAYEHVLPPGTTTRVRVDLYPSSEGRNATSVVEVEAVEAATGYTPHRARAVLLAVRHADAEPSGPTGGGVSPVRPAVDPVGALRVDAGSGTLVVNVTNPAPYPQTFEIRAHLPDGYDAGAPRSVLVLGNQRETVALQVRGENATRPGGGFVVVRNGDAAHVLVTRHFAVQDPRATRPAEPTPSPPAIAHATPGRVEAVADPERTANVSIQLRAPHAPNASTFLVRAESPTGWRYLGPSNATVPAGGNATMELRFRAENASAAAGDALLRLTAANDASLVTLVEVALRLPAPATAPPPPGTNGSTTEPNATTPAPTPRTNDTPVDAPAPKEDPDEAPPGPAEGPTEETPPPPPVPFRLVAVDTGAVVAPGGVVLVAVDLISTHDADLDVDLRLDVPPGLRGELPATPLSLARQETRRLHLLLHADADLVEGTDLATTLHAEAREGLARLSIVLRVQVPPPPMDDSKDVDRQQAAVVDAGGGLLTARFVVAGAAVLGAAGGAFALRRRWPLLAAALYTRLQRSAILDHPVRARLMDLVRAEPGLTMSEAQRRLGLANGMMAYHLRTLEKAGVLFTSLDGQQRRIYVHGAGRVEAVPGLADRALRLVLDEGGMWAGDVARELGVSRQALHYHVRKLVREGKLKARVDGREVWLAPHVRP